MVSTAQSQNCTLKHTNITIAATIIHQVIGTDRDVFLSTVSPLFIRNVCNITHTTYSHLGIAKKTNNIYTYKMVFIVLLKMANFFRE